MDLETLYHAVSVRHGLTAALKLDELLGSGELPDYTIGPASSRETQPVPSSPTVPARGVTVRGQP